MGFSRKEKWAAQGGRAPPPSLVLLGLGEVAGHLSLSLSPLGVLFGVGLGGGVLLPVGVGLLLRPPPGRRPPPPWLLYIRRQGSTLGHTS